jgi:nitrite reductase/ring-hydroxylating ferredoxin subunit
MWEFDSRTGACLVDDQLAIPTYRVKVEDGEILLDVPQPDLPQPGGEV